MLETINPPTGEQKEISLEERIVVIKLNVFIEIEKRIIYKYTPLLMIKRRSKIEAQTEWINLYAKRYKGIFNLKKMGLLPCINKIIIKLLIIWKIS